MAAVRRQATADAGGDADAGAGALAARLLAPARRLAVRDLAADWFMAGCRLRMRGYGGPKSSARLAGRLRGALGTVLKRSASAAAVAGRPCPWRPPCALDALYRAQGRITPALEIPKPYLLALDIAGDRVEVELSLVGFASDWLEEAAGALVQAWRHHLADARGSEIVDRRLWATQGIELPPADDGIVMDFRMPLEVRWRRGPPASGRDAMAGLMASLGNRISGLSRWQDCEIEADWRALKSAAAALDVVCLASQQQTWRRRSGLQNRWIPMQGDRPTLLLRGDLAPLLPWLAIGARVHVGSHAALGMGRYSLLAPSTRG